MRTRHKFCQKCGQALTDVAVEGSERVRLRSPYTSARERAIRRTDTSVRDGRLAHRYADDLRGAKESVLVLDDAGHYKVGFGGPAEHRHYVTLLQQPSDVGVDAA